MNPFFLIAVPTAAASAEEARCGYTAYLRRRGVEPSWHRAGAAWVAVGGHRGAAEPSVTRCKAYTAVGFVRLDNRPDVERWMGSREQGLSDLDLVVRFLDRQGAAGVPRLLGDFAFVIWDIETREVLAARDALGVRTLYYAEGPHCVAFASRAELLALDERFDLQTLTELAALCSPTANRTAYAGVHAVPPGSTAALRSDRVYTAQFWSPEQFEVTAVAPGRERELCEQFRDLFRQSVQAQLGDSENAWAQLSGGLDSSSVVSMAQWLARTGAVRHGIAGTISWVYRWSTDGDERQYSSALARAVGVTNEVQEDWPWEDDGASPPLTDEPSPEYLMYARDRRMLRAVRAGGGRVLLTGFGSDQYLLGNMFFFADRVAHGDVWASAREMLRRATIGRVSFWRLAYENAILPLLPASIQRWVIEGWALPAWIPPALAKRRGLRHTDEARYYAARPGSKYKGLVMEEMRSLPPSLRRHEILEAELDVRHPFLHRALVEFGLRLPPEMCVQPQARKWVLREAMRGILPEIVRARVGKGANAGAILQSLIQERRRIEPLLVDPLLGQFGCIDPHELRIAYARACSGTAAARFVGSVTEVLALEAWLRVRSGRCSLRRSGTSGITTQQDNRQHVL